MEFKAPKITFFSRLDDQDPRKSSGNSTWSDCKMGIQWMECTV